MERAKAIAGKHYCPFPTGVPVLKSLFECERVNLALVLNKVFVNQRLWLWQKDSWDRSVVEFGLGSSFKTGFFFSSYDLILCTCFVVTRFLFI